MRAAFVLGAALALAGCHGEATPDAPGATANASGTPAPKPTARAMVAPAQVHHAIVDAEGLAIGRNPGTAPYFRFGTSRTEVEAAADKWLGAADGRSKNAECGAGPMEFTRYGKLTLNWQDGKLAGWLMEAEPQAVTSDGIKPGAFMRDLAVTRSVRMVPDSTLEGEFQYLAADGHPIGGFQKGSGHDATIQSLYAGVNCFFR